MHRTTSEIRVEEAKIHIQSLYMQLGHDQENAEEDLWMRRLRSKSKSPRQVDLQL